MLGKQEERSVFGSKDDHRIKLAVMRPGDYERKKPREHMMPDGSMMKDEDMPKFNVMPRARPSVMPRKSMFGYK